MAKKPARPEVGPPQLPPHKGVQLLESLKAEGETLLQQPHLSSDAHETWKLKARNCLAKAFGENSPNIGSVTAAGPVAVILRNTSEAEREQRRRSALQSQLARLQGLIELLQIDAGDSLAADEPAPQAAPRPSAAGSKRVFVVHGRDHALLHQVARVLEQLKLDAVILHEQANEGRTIIEKFEDHADVGFAVVLLTADDIGGLHGTPPDQLKPRARQNVIFELGFFSAKLTRKRVCALCAPGVERPSDYDGVLYVEIDPNGAWKFTLAREPRSAGLPVDLNDL